jgi:hypothetical protein
MFYRKTDIEVLCDTLIKLIDKHDKVYKKYGPNAAAPHAKALELVSSQLDAMVEIDLNPIYVRQPNGNIERAKKPVDEKTPTRRFIGASMHKKRGRPPKTQANITIMHGASDDVHTERHQVRDPNAQEEVPTDQTLADLKKSEEDVAAGRVTTYKTGQEALQALEREEKPTNPQTHKPVNPQTGIVTPDNIDNLADQLPR